MICCVNSRENVANVTLLQSLHCSGKKVFTLSNIIDTMLTQSLLYKSDCILATILVFVFQKGCEKCKTNAFNYINSQKQQ